MEVQVSALPRMKSACGAWSGHLAIVWRPNTPAPSLYFKTYLRKSNGPLSCDVFPLVRHPVRPPLELELLFWVWQVGQALTLSVRGQPMEHGITAASQADPGKG